MDSNLYLKNTNKDFAYNFISTGFGWDDLKISKVSERIKAFLFLEPENGFKEIAQYIAEQQYDFTECNVWYEAACSLYYLSLKDLLEKYANDKLGSYNKLTAREKGFLMSCIKELELNQSLYYQWVDDCFNKIDWRVSYGETRKLYQHRIIDAALELLFYKD